MAYTVVSFSIWVINEAVCTSILTFLAAIFEVPTTFPSFSFTSIPVNSSWFLISTTLQMFAVATRRERENNWWKNFEPAFLSLFNFSYRVKGRKLLQTTHTKKNSCYTVELSWQKKNPSKHEILNFSQLSAIHVQSCCCASNFFPWRRRYCRRQRRNENVKKTIDLDQQNNNFARASRFFAHFFAVTAQLRRESWLISRFVENDFLFLLLNFDTVV